MEDKAQESEREGAGRSRNRKRWSRARPRPELLSPASPRDPQGVLAPCEGSYSPMTKGRRPGHSQAGLGPGPPL